MRKMLLICLLCLSFLITGCDLLPDLRIPFIPTPTAISTQLPTDTPQPTATLPEVPDLPPTTTPIVDIEEVIPIETPIAVSEFIPQDGAPFYLPNFTHPAAGCAWMGVAGQVFDQAGAELLGLTITSGNAIDGEESHRAALTGLSTAYGLGGYEIHLSDAAMDSSGVYWVQILDQDGEPLSEKFFFDTYQNCERNLVLVNFIPLNVPSEP